MAKVRIDQGELEGAFSSGDGTEHWFLDRQTGAIIWVSDDEMLNAGFPGGDDEEDEEEEDAEFEFDDDEPTIWRMIERNPDRYVEIPSLGSHDGFRMMERFVASLDRGPARHALDEALRRRKPFRSFKDALSGFPDVRERWFAYESAELREEAEAWLRSEEIDYELVAPGTEPQAEADPRA